MLVNIDRIHHVAIISSNYERSKHFYVDLLGMTIVNETYRAERDSYKLDLRIGQTDQQIELFSFPSPPARVNKPEARGLRHLAFVVPDMDESVRELESKGIAVEPVRIDPITGDRYTFFADPDGLPLELVEHA